MLATVQDVKLLLDTGVEEINKKNLKNAVDKVEMWRSRPINFSFMEQVLIREGLYFRLMFYPGSSGKTIGQISKDITDQSRITGAMNDIGEFDAEKADDMLSYGALDWAVTDENAMEVKEFLSPVTTHARL